MTDTDRTPAAEPAGEDLRDPEATAPPPAAAEPDAAPPPARKGTDWWGEIKAIFTGFEASVRRMRELIDEARTS